MSVDRIYKRASKWFVPTMGLVDNGGMGAWQLGCCCEEGEECEHCDSGGPAIARLTVSGSTGGSHPIGCGSCIKLDGTWDLLFAGPCAWQSVLISVPSGDPADVCPEGGGGSTYQWFLTVGASGLITAQLLLNAGAGNQDERWQGRDSDCRNWLNFSLTRITPSGPDYCTLPTFIALTAA